jgi:hypothetical protein
MQSVPVDCTTSFAYAGSGGGFHTINKAHRAYKIHHFLDIQESIICQHALNKNFLAKLKGSNFRTNQGSA